MAYPWGEEITTLIDRYPPKEIQPPAICPLRIAPTLECNDLFTNWEPNPLQNVYGSNFFIDECCDEDLNNDLNDLPRLPAAILGLDIFDDDELFKTQFLEVVHVSENSVVFKVIHGGQTRALKVFHYGTHDVERFEAEYEMAKHCLKMRCEAAGTKMRKVKPFRLPPLLDRFEKECDAYENIRATPGLCKEGEGVVPCVYGAFHIPGPLDEFWSTQGQNLSRTWLKDFIHDPGLNFALLLEFVDGMQVTLENVTFDIGKKALKAVAHLHRARVAHQDLRPRNILVTPENRVVIVDFEHSLVGDKDSFEEYECCKEMWQTWSLFFRFMLPDKMFGENVWGWFEQYC